MSVIVLETAGARAEIAARGAELRAWSVDGRPLLWAPDPAIWAETAPILFPIVGWTRNSRVVIDGESYPLGLHGFARTLDFEVVEHGSAHARLVARSCDATRMLYPFDWTLTVDYTLAQNALTTRLTVRNDDEDQGMPFACGLHPGFRWPFAGGDLDDYAIVFAEPEETFVPVISPAGLFTYDARDVPIEGRRLPLSAALFDKEALCFLGARSKSLRFTHASGAAIDIALENFSHIALWSKPEGRFLSIEAWTGHGDLIDAGENFFDKPSMRYLFRGESATHAATFSYLAANVGL